MFGPGASPDGCIRAQLCTDLVRAWIRILPGTGEDYPHFMLGD